MSCWEGLCSGARHSVPEQRLAWFARVFLELLGKSPAFAAKLLATVARFLVFLARSLAIEVPFPGSVASCLASLAQLWARWNSVTSRA